MSKDREEVTDALREKRADFGESLSVGKGSRCRSLPRTESGRLECTPRWLLSMSEVAQLLGISRTLLWELAKEEDFPSIRLHTRQYVRVEALLAWIRAKEHPERAQATPTSVA